MWNLREPERARLRERLDLAFPDNVENQIVDAAMKDKIIHLYGLYIDRSGRPSDELRDPGLPAEILLAIREGYSLVQDGRRLADMRDEIKLGATECPYCGFGQIEDLDHHLPKAFYQAFSIFSTNLVPSCATCNRSKPRSTSTDPTKHLLHAYLEGKPEVVFFRAAVDVAQGAVSATFYIEKSESLGDEWHARLEHHVAVFKLRDRYPAQVNIYLAGLKVSFETIHEMLGAQGLRTYLAHSATSNARRFGINDWRTALLFALSESHDFCEGGFRFC